MFGDVGHHLNAIEVILGGSWFVLAIVISLSGEGGQLCAELCCSFP